MIRSKEIAEALYALHERSIKFIELSLLQKGLALYQQQAVITMDMKHTHVVAAKVRDTDTYEAQLNIHLLGNSACTCRSKEICSHIIAVYFAAYAYQGFRPEIIVRKASERVGQGQTKPQEIALPASKPEEPKSASIQSTDSVAVWHSYFHAKFRQFPSTNGFTDYNTMMYRITKQLSALCQDWSNLMQYFFMLHGCLFQLQKLEEHGSHTPNNRSSYNLGLKDAIQDCYQRLDAQLEKLNNADSSRLTPQHREQTAMLLSEIAFPQEPTWIDWDYFYRIIWNILLKSPIETANEKSRLLKALKQLKLSKNQQKATNLALAYHWYIEGNDTPAMHCLEASGVKLERYDIDLYLAELSQRKEPTRLLNWLLWYKSHLTNASQHVIEQYLDYWTPLVPQHLSEEALQQVISDFLPGSSAYYINRLIQKESYATLIDFMLTYNMSLSKLPPGITRKIEAKQAELLLPYHHQAVEFFISRKNRDAYKDAIKAMKKINFIYKKLKQPEHWERYYSWIVSNYSRLSALQEEMLKGLKQP
ncbi:MAG: hypothetical protein WD469_12855 [Paenibacillaceae bacterium]